MPSFKAVSSRIFAENLPSSWLISPLTATASAHSIPQKPKKQPISSSLLTKSFQTINHATCSAWDPNRATSLLALNMVAILLTALHLLAKLATVLFIRRTVASIFAMLNIAKCSNHSTPPVTAIVVKITQQHTYTIFLKSMKSPAKPSPVSTMNILSSKFAIGSAQASSMTLSKITCQTL